MKTIVALIIDILPLSLVAEPNTASPANPLIGTWILDVAKTKENRENLKALPPRVALKLSPEEVRPRILVFTEHTLSIGTQVSDFDFTYHILKREGDSILVEYLPPKEGLPLYCWWELPSPDMAINYVIVFDLDSPSLESKEVASFYHRKKNEWRRVITR